MSLIGATWLFVPTEFRLHLVQFPQSFKHPSGNCPVMRSEPIIHILIYFAVQQI